MRGHKSFCTITIRDEGRAGIGARLLGAEHICTVEVETSFDEEFVNAIKRIPYTDREWDATAKRWWFHESQLEEVTRLALVHFKDVHLVTGDVTTNLRTGESYSQSSLF